MGGRAASARRQQPGLLQGERPGEVEHEAGGLRREIAEAHLRHARAADREDSLLQRPEHRRHVDHHAVRPGQGEDLETHGFGEVQDQPGHVVVLSDADVLDRRRGQNPDGDHRREQ